MTIVIDGTTGISGVDGTASNPSYEGTDSNTGIFFPAADTVAIGTGGTEALRVNSSQNVGIGTSSPSQKLQIAGGNSNYLRVDDTTNSVANLFGSAVGNGIIGTFSNHPLLFHTNSTERARITSGGFFKASNDGTYLNAGVFHELRNNGTDWNTIISNTNATPSNLFGLNIYYTNATANGTGNWFLYCQDPSALRASIRSNGGLANYSANNANLSDRREKTNFAPAKNYLDVICAIPIQTFNYIDQNLEEDDGLTLGVVAQDVQAVAPEMVMESNWGTKEEPKMRLSIYQTDLQYALMKSIQELKAIVDAQAAEIAALKAQP